MEHTQPTVLFIDDDTFFVDVIGNKLTQENISCVYAPNGQMALDLLSSGTRPGVILLDIAMPDMDGFEVLKKIKDNPTDATIPVVMFSNDATPENRTKATELGATDFLEKVQVTPGEVVDLIRKLSVV